MDRQGTLAVTKMGLRGQNAYRIRRAGSQGRSRGKGDGIKELNNDSCKLLKMGWPVHTSNKWHSGQKTQVTTLKVAGRLAEPSLKGGWNSKGRFLVHIFLIILGEPPKFPLSSHHQGHVRFLHGFVEKR